MSRDLMYALPCAYSIHAGGQDLHMQVMARGGTEGNVWAITNGAGCCLNDEGEWEYEPQPSSRTLAFLGRTRFSLSDAFRRAFAAVDHPIEGSP